MKEILITSSVLILAITALRFIFREKISRRLQYALWALVLLRLLCPVSLPATRMSVLSGTQALEESIAIQQNLDGNIVLPQVPESPLPDAPAAEAPAVEKSVDWGKLLRSLWLGGAAVMALWFLGVNLRLARALRKNRREYAVEDFPLPVYLTDKVVSPCLFGLFRPAVYLTQKAVETEESRRHVLTHELCHYRHKDHIVSFLRCLCLSIYWFNPLVWLAAVLSKADGEMACDEAVLHRLGEENRLSYGRTLVDMIARGHSSANMLSAATTMVDGKSSIRRRLTRIVKGKKTALWAVVCVMLCIAICVGCTFTAGKTPDTPAPDPIVQDDPVIAPMPEGTFQLTHIYENTEYAVPNLSAETLWEIAQNGHGETFDVKYIGEFEHVFRIRHEKPDGSAQDFYCYRSDEGQPLILAAGEVRRLEETLMLELEKAIGMHQPLYDSLRITRTVTDSTGGQVTDGDGLEFVITITNISDTDLADIFVKDVVGKHSGLSSIDGEIVSAGGDPTWTVDIPKGQTVTLRYKVKVGGLPGDHIYSYGGSVAGIPFPPLVTYITAEAY